MNCASKCHEIQHKIHVGGYHANNRYPVTLDEKLVRELVKISNAKSKTATVSLAVKEQIRRTKLKELAGIFGTVDVDETAIAESVNADLEQAKWLGEMTENGHGEPS